MSYNFLSQFIKQIIETKNNCITKKTETISMTLIQLIHYSRQKLQLYFNKFDNEDICNFEGSTDADLH